MFENWILAAPGEVALVLLSSLVAYAAILLYTRILGLRSLSKMSAADFAMTVAVGSALASTITSPSPSLLLGLVAIAALYLCQWIVARGRMASPWISRRVDNQPLLLMRDGRFIDEHLRRARVTKNDIYGKLRSCNAVNLAHVRAVVMETTGDVSVLHGDPDAPISPELLGNVIVAEPSEFIAHTEP